MDTDESPRRFGREAVWVVAMTLLGAGLRLKGLGALGLDHFDEGIYAQAATWIFSDGGIRAIDRGLIPYAPPGYPVLVGLAFAAIGASGTAAILASILAGTLTIPVVSWMARMTFGRGAGAASAALMALSGPHVVFSRTALTDATFLLAWVLAMVAGMHFLERPGGWRAVRLGVFVGLAQLVKYNGWMSGAIVASAVLAGAIRPGEGRRSSPRTAAFGLMAAAVSAAVYLPWFVFVERTTGYAGLIAHHRGYVDGLPGWWPNWRRQMAQAEALEGVMAIGFSWLGGALALAWIGSAIGQGRTPRSWGRLGNLGPMLALLLAVASLAAPANLGWWAALAWSPILLLDRRPGPRLVGSWFLVMAASTPLYHPYARLWLPTLAASWVVGGGLVAGLLSWFRRAGDEPEEVGGRSVRRLEPAAIAAIAAVALAAIGPMLLPDEVRRFPDPLARSDGVRAVASRVLELDRPPGSGAPTVHVFARPALRFYLLEGGSGPVLVHGDLESLRAASPKAGQVAVVDAGLGVTEAEAATVGEGTRWRLDSRLIVPASIPTLLDVRPGSVYDPGARHLGRAPADPPDDDSGGDPAGTCCFWIFSAR